MLCKESMVTAPVAIVLYERIFRFASFRQALRANGVFYGALGATWLMLGGLLLGCSRAPRSASTQGSIPWTYLLNPSARSCGHYLNADRLAGGASLGATACRARSRSRNVWPEAAALNAAVHRLRRPAVPEAGGRLSPSLVFIMLAPTSKSSRRLPPRSAPSGGCTYPWPASPCSWCSARIGC